MKAATPAPSCNEPQQAGLSHVLIKIADGSSAYNVDLAAPVVDALKAAGLKVWGWQFVYGNEPFGEADIAIHRIGTLALDGFVVNAESAYKGKHAAAEAYIHRLRDAVPDLDVALSSFRYPEYHSQLALDRIPGAIAPITCHRSTGSKPTIPANSWSGASTSSVVSTHLFLSSRPAPHTKNSAGEPTASQLTRFLQKAKELGLPAANFWSWDYAGSSSGSDLWDAVASFDWPVQLEPNIVDKLETALNSGNADLVVELYQENAVHVNFATHPQRPHRTAPVLRRPAEQQATRSAILHDHHCQRRFHTQRQLERHLNRRWSRRRTGYHRCAPGPDSVPQQPISHYLTHPHHFKKKDQSTN